MQQRRSELRARRRERGLTQEAMALTLDVSLSTVSSWERGLRAPHLRIRPAIARLLGVSVAEVTRWFSGVEPAEGIMPSWLGVLAEHEQGASEIWTYEPIVVPSLLQTLAYARATQRREPGPPGEDEIERAAQARIARQHVLTRSPDPLRLHALVDESVLLRPIGGPAVMADQLRHLGMLADMPNVTIQVLPLDCEVCSAAFGHFKVLSSPRLDRPYMADVLDRGGAHYLDRKDDLERHVRLFEHLVSAALTEADTLALLESVIQERYA